LSPLVGSSMLRNLLDAHAVIVAGLPGTPALL
jgi:hypothetical protein